VDDWVRICFYKLGYRTYVVCSKGRRGAQCVLVGLSTSVGEIINAKCA